MSDNSIPPDAARLRCKKCGKDSWLTREQRRDAAGETLDCPHCGKRMKIPPAKSASLWSAMERGGELSSDAPAFPSDSIQPPGLSPESHRPN